MERLLRILGWAAAVAALLVLAPVASARHEENIASQRFEVVATGAAQTLRGELWDRLGAKGVTMPLERPVTPAVRVVRVSEPDTFDWRDAGLGAAVTALGLAVIGTAALVVTRHGSGTDHRGVAHA